MQQTFDDSEATPVAYFDTRFNRDAIKLLPGQYFATSADKLIVTVLGSCVAACIRDPIARIGGMNHFMLPEAARDDDRVRSMLTRYGLHAMTMLIAHIEELGGRRERLEAKVFGGGKVLNGFEKCDVGQINAKFVQAFLTRTGIPVVGQDLCQDYARKIYYMPATGDVYMKRIQRYNNTTIFDREQRHRQNLLAQNHNVQI